MARNTVLVPGVMKLSRSAVYARRGLYKTKKAVAPAKPAAAATTKTVTVGSVKVLIF